MLPSRFRLLRFLRPRPRLIQLLRGARSLSLTPSIPTAFLATGVAAVVWTASHCPSLPASASPFEGDLGEGWPDEDTDDQMFFTELKSSVARVIRSAVIDASDFEDIRKAAAVIEAQVGEIFKTRISPEAFYFLWKERYSMRSPREKTRESFEVGHWPVRDVNMLKDLLWVARFTQLTYHSSNSIETLEEALGRFGNDIPVPMIGGESLAHLALKFAGGDFLASQATQLELEDEEMRAALAQKLVPSNRTGEWKVLYLQSESRSGAPAHFLAVNHETRSAMLCIRGTKTLADAITDMHCDREILQWRRNRWYSRLFSSEKGTAHSGMARSAQLLADLHCDTLSSLSSDGYRICLAGHSLGAGTAAILATQLQGTLPFVKAYCFATPPCLTEGLAKRCKSYVTSVVLDDDVVPRCSTHAILKLHNELCHVQVRLPSLINQMASEILAAHEFPGRATALERFREKSKEEETIPEVQFATIPDDRTQLRPPGTIIFIHRTNGDPSMRPVVAQSSFFDRILLSKTMLTDHLFRSYIEALEVCLCKKNQ